MILNVKVINWNFSTKIVNNYQANFSTFNKLNLYKSYKFLKTYKKGNFFRNKYDSFKFIKNEVSVNNLSILKKNHVTSNASRSSFFLKKYIPNMFKFKNKLFMYSSYSSNGRSLNGIVCRPKGKKILKIRYPLINKSFRNLSLSFVAGFFTVPFSYKTLSLIMSSSGEISYVPTTTNHTLFKISKFYSIFEHHILFNKYDYLSEFIKINQIFFLILQLPKFKVISFLEIYPQKGSQYVQSPGSKSYLIKLDTKNSVSLIKLPSGVHKIFSSYSNGSNGSIPFSFKNLKTQSNAGFFKKKGKKSLSRGVAKNPIDHPHGGRNKAIKYQRTPWGKTTKFK